MSGPLAQVLVRRGLAEPARARAFLAAEEEHPPSAFAGIELAVEPILRHVRAASGSRFTGTTTSTASAPRPCWCASLRRLGANVDWYLPDRASDGYGLNPATVQRLAQRGTRLLVTVDCAITAVDGGRSRQRRSGWRWWSPTTTPRAPTACCRDAPIVHPALCGYPCPDLCATAVAYKLAQALERRPRRRLARGDAVDPARRARASGGGSRPGGAGHDRRRGAARGREPHARAARPARARGHRQARAARADGGRAGRSGQAERALGRLRAGAATERRRAPVPRRRGARS